MDIIELSVNPAYDVIIRALLVRIDEEGALHIANEFIGMAGGVEALRKLANSTEELHGMDRALIGLHMKRLKAMAGVSL